MFSFSAENTKCNITVGYISSERGFVDGVGLYEANHIAKLNPGTQFIFRNRDFVKYLNINEVNALSPDKMLPEGRAGAGSCSGIVGLNLEGDTSKSIDVDLGIDPAVVGGSTRNSKAVAEENKTRVDFYGGGGVGVQAAPIIGIDGSVLAVQVIRGGYGYKYPPIVDIHDDTGKGAGVVARSVIKTRSSDDPELVEEFDAEEDYEEYVLDKCVPEMENIGYGQRWNADGKNLGKWDPMVYFNKQKDPIKYEIQRYQKFLADLKDGTRIDGNRIKGWWTTRHKSPLRIISPDKIAREKFDVQHPAWGGLVTIQPNPLPKTSSTFGVATSLIESSFLVYTSGGQRRDLKFIFKEKSGDHRFEIRADDYKNNASAEEIKIKVKRNTIYTVTTTSRKGIRDQGLLKKGTFGTGGDIAQRSGTSNAIFSDIAKTAPDDDDLQVQCKQGVFSIDNKNITYELKDSAAYNAEKNSMYGEGLKDNKNTITTDSFMNQYAVSPVPPSNVKGSDQAGKNYILEWEEEFPWDGTYIFNIQADNEAHLFLDNDPIGEKVLLGAGGAAGHVLSPPQKFQKFVKGGMHTISIDLLNHQIREMKKIQTDVVDTSDEVTFNISISSMFANGISIEGLGIDVLSVYEGPVVKETLTKKVEYGRVYPVKIRSSGFKQETSSSSTTINFSGLKKPGDLRFANSTRLEFDDDSANGFDLNASFTIDRVNGGTAKFTSDAKGLDIKGDKVEITLTYAWADNPRKSGTALDSIKIGSTIWTHLKQRSGSETHTITLSGSSSNSTNSSTIKLKTKGEKVIAMEDLPDQEAGSGGASGPGFFDDLICSVNNGRFFGISGSTCSFIVDPPTGGDNSSLTKRGERAHVFNTVDWIGRANRRLWKINPTAGLDSDFANRFGVLPFDPTEVEKVEKKRTRDITKQSKATVNFFKEADGRNYMKVTGTGRVKVFFEMNINDRPGISSLALTEIKINADDSDITLRRDPNRRYANEKASGEFTAGQKYLVKTIGASSGSGSIIGSDKTTIGYDDDITNGYDQNGLLKITAINPINITQTINETVVGYPDYPNASTDDYAGFHEIIWNNITFPEDGNYSITTVVDDNVTLTFTKPNEPDIFIEKKGFRIRGDHKTGTGKSVEVKYFKSGSYTLKAVLEQIPGAPLAHGNPMLIALDIKAAFLSDEIEVISAKSWNENPMGVAMAIDSPMAPKISEPPQQQEGRCPNNPIWTTRSQTDTNATWYPVNVDFWAKFMNRYAISPLPPLGLKGTDGAGTVYRNSWVVQLPYRGFYGVKGTADDFGKLFIDGVEVLGPNVDKQFDSPKLGKPKAKKIFLEKKTIKISVEVENKKDFIWQTIDQKVFSTADWASKQTKTEKTVEGPKNVDVTFKVSSSAGYANNIDMRGVFSVGKSYGGPNFNETYNRNIEVGKVYDVVFTSNNQAQRSTNIPIVYNGLNAANNPINVVNGGRSIRLKDSDGNDANATITIDKTDGGSVIFTDDGKGFKVTGGTAAKRVNTTITLSWNDNPRTAGVAINSFSVADKTWNRTGRSGTVTKSVYIYPPNANNNQNNNANIRLRNKGKGVVQMEDWTDNDWSDIIASATEGEFYNMVGNTCKFRVPPTNTTEIVYGKGLTSGSSKGGVTYDGPPLSTYASGELGPFITPTWNTDEEYIANFNGKTWTMTFSDVDFPEKGTYDIQAEADDKLIIKLDGVEITTAEVGSGITKAQFTAPKGKRTIELTLTNLDFNAPFKTNPTVAAVKITRKVQVAKVDPKSGTALGKPWTSNPIGVSAILIPPPCPKKINGVGIVTDVIITDPGNGFDPPIKEIDPDLPTGPDVIMEIDKIIPEDEGINYDPDDKVCIVNTETGEEVCFIPPKGPFGEIQEFDPRKTPPTVPGPPDPTPPSEPPPAVEPDVGITAIPSVIVKGDCTNLIYTSARNTSLKIDKGVGNVPVVSRGEVKVCPPVTTTYTIEGDASSATTVVTVVEDPNDPLLDSPPAPELPPAPNGYRSYPQIIVRGRGTGIGYKGIPVMKAVIDPIGVDPNRLIQVTDLPGLKQTGYYNGKPYYGAVFYENGIRYAGYYDTPGQKVQIYDTMIESINATVTTPPSAIQRSGTDTNSNNPRLNIPGTPDNLA